MQIHIRNIIPFLFLTYLLGCSAPATKSKAIENTNLNNNLRGEFGATKLKAIDAYQFCLSQKFNTQFCILINMGVHSGLKRFLVWDFKLDTIVYSFLVGHGCGNYPWNSDFTKENPTFSNEDGSHCSSLGKYKIGERAYSDWGVHIKYVLHGLESTNSNAIKRYIVFHSWEQVPDEEIYPNGTPEGWGCPTISNNSFEILDPIIKSSNKPVLFWMYN
ncbi:MAG: murein L,D-transpeptidase catalytic domain family protein [bacterium]|nr:murein L,D-transpeptidase catalytic domain family protein [bacterium]